jgi:hypothetical protein
MRAWSSDPDIVRVRRSFTHLAITAHHAGRKLVACPRPHQSSRATPDLSELDPNL